MFQLKAFRNQLKGNGKGHLIFSKTQGPSLFHQQTKLTIVMKYQYPNTFPNDLKYIWKKKKRVLYTTQTKKERKKKENF